MTFRSRTVLSVAVLLASCGLWVGVWYLDMITLAGATQSAKLASSLQGSSLREAVQARTRTLFADTAASRAELAAFVHVDVVAAAKAIEAVGPRAQANLKVTNVSQEQVPVPKSGLAHPLKAFSYTVEVQGTFAQVMRAAELLEQLPMPVVMTRASFAIDATDEKGAALWRLSETLRLLTDSDISS